MPAQLLQEEITYFATTDFRNQATPFGIKQSDRRAHMYILGKTGTGKSNLLETLIRQDLLNGNGLALLDPHGDLVEKVLSEVPAEQRADLVYFDATDTEHTLGLPVDLRPAGGNKKAAGPWRPRR